MSPAKPPSTQAANEPHTNVARMRAGFGLSRHKLDRLAGSRLFRQDGLILRNIIRATFAGWHDRVIAVALLLVFLAVARSYFADREWMFAAWSALAASIVVGAGAGRLLAARLAFHSLDGLLADDALHPGTRRRYLLIWHSLGIVMLATITLIARPSLLIVSLPAYLAGVLISRLASDLRITVMMAGRTRPGWVVRAWLHRPGAGAAAAIVLLVSLLPAQALTMSALMAFVGIGTILLVVMLTALDHGTVRFMTIAGHGARRIIAYYGKSTVSFAAVAVPGCWLTLGPVAAAIVGGASAAMLLLMTLRILAFRLHGQRFADLLVSILAGLLMLVTYWLPLALPVAALALLWNLQRRGSAMKWLLA